MVDKGPLLTSAIIFYLSIGAAIFQVLEEPNWKQAAAQYRERKERILEEYPCLSREDLDRILEVCCCEWMWCRRAGPDSECGCPAPAEEGSAAAQHSLKWNFVVRKCLHVPAVPSARHCGFPEYKHHGL